jgi:hypothetical protein
MHSAKLLLVGVLLDDLPGRSVTALFRVRMSNAGRSSAGNSSGFWDCE